MAVFLFIVAVITVVIFLFFAFRKVRPEKVPDIPVQKTILQQYVRFYRQLDADRKSIFEDRVNRFLLKTRITGVKTEIDDMDRVFVAAAAIIPIFAFRDWEYRNIHEVLLYPDAFTRNFRIEGAGRDTLGMVGNGPMQNMMILSRKDLRDGFLFEGNDSNPAIHEFVHLIDKTDGATDGLPEILLHHSYALPWIHRMNEEIQKIHAGQSDINPYGASNEAEFLAVVAEYFFNQPEKMSQRHPELYNMLKSIFLPAESSGH